MKHYKLKEAIKGIEIANELELVIKAEEIERIEVEGLLSFQSY